jgi:hypothetical protein
MVSQSRLTRRAALAALGAGTVLGLAYALRGILGSPTPAIRLTDDGGGMMGVSAMDMSRYMEMFNRHNEITRSVEEIPGRGAHHHSVELAGSLSRLGYCSSGSPLLGPPEPRL